MPTHTVELIDQDADQLRPGDTLLLARPARVVHVATATLHRDDTVTLTFAEPGEEAWTLHRTLALSTIDTNNTPRTRP